MPNKTEEQLNEEIMNKKELDFGKMLSESRQQGRDEVINKIENMGINAQDGFDYVFLTVLADELRNQLKGVKK